MSRSACLPIQRYTLPHHQYATKTFYVRGEASTVMYYAPNIAASIHMALWWVLSSPALHSYTLISDVNGLATIPTFHEDSFVLSLIP